MLIQSALPDSTRPTMTELAGLAEMRATTTECAVQTSDVSRAHLPYHGLAFALAVFLSSFLLFQIQPLIAKFILPWYGGSPGVWTTCLLFFQLMLLAGYLYAHLVVLRLQPRAQFVLHLALLGTSLLLLPITPADRWSDVPADRPTLHLLGVLILTVGGPYLMLSANAPLMQSWFSQVKRNRSPYRLYALSNVGSLLALFTFPVLFEPVVSSPEQSWLWSWAYVVFAGLCGWCGALLWSAGRSSRLSSAMMGDLPADSPIHPANDAATAAPRPFAMAMWLVLTACGSVMLMATTNQICQDVASVPFLWVLPLSLYLLSFIICFDRETWYLRAVFMPLLVASVAASFVVLSISDRAPILVQIGVFSAALFACSMMCHGELVRLKPSTQHLTLFYLMVALGGALGGVLVALIAPLVFDGFLEFQLGLLACCLLVIVVMRPDLISVLLSRENRRLRWFLTAASCGAAVGLWALSTREVGEERHGVLAADRNFYGSLKVVRDVSQGAELANIRLTHGSTVHGIQFVADGLRGKPTTYYVPQSGVGRAMASVRAAKPDRPLQIGVVGLGAGSLAAYALPGDNMRFYEINPTVVDFAEKYFTFLADARQRGASIDVGVGDARILLQRELDQGKAREFDLLVVDAFSGDSIPIHLLTSECFDLYWRHLRRGGLLAVHVSNRHLNLVPVVANQTIRSDRAAVVIKFQPDKTDAVQAALTAQSDWVLAGADRELLSDIGPLYNAAVDGTDAGPLWTDESSSLFQVLR